MFRSVIVLLASAILVSGCATDRKPDAGSSTGPSGAPSAPKRITAAIMSEPATLSRANIIAGSGTYPGGDALEEMANAGLTHSDNEGRRLAQLAETVPTVENGLWKLLPDGRMETTWKLRPGLVWHDGTPLTTADLLFTSALSQDRDLPTFRSPEYRSIASMDTPDPRTLVVAWSEPYVRADELFLTVRPQHILGKSYAAEKMSVLSHPYWTREYVGSGPYKVRQWEAGSYVIFDAFDGYALGRPKVDSITVKFISDSRALMANILAGEIDLTLGRNLSLQQAIEIRDAVKDGRIEIGFESWIAMYPQFINPTPQLVTNLQFRKALMHAIQREELVETLQYGMSPVAHVFLHPSDAIYKDVESNIVKYDYDPRRSAQLLEGIGLSRGPDGFFRDQAGQPMILDVRTSAGDDTHEAATLTITEQFRRAGVSAETYFIPQARRSDLEFATTFPGLRLSRKDNTIWAVARYHSRETPLPESKFVGSNDARYMNPQLDGLIDRYLGTIATPERIRIMGDIVGHTTDQVTAMGLFYNTEPHLISNRLQNRVLKKTGLANDAWNPEAWDVNN